VHLGVEKKQTDSCFNKQHVCGIDVEGLAWWCFKKKHIDSLDIEG